MHRLAAAAALPLLGAGAAPCPPAFIQHEHSYIVSHVENGKPDPKFFTKPGIYGTTDPAAPKDASLKGAQTLCLGSPVCKGFSFRDKSNPDDISAGVFFYGNDKVYSSSKQPTFMSYTLNPAYASAPASCKSGGGGAGPTPPGNSTGGGAEEGGCGGGCFFLIAFFCGGTVYLAAGFAYNYKRRELRGVEALPHLDFWKDVPFLVKDGVVFSFTKVRQAARRDGSYTTV